MINSFLVYSDYALQIQSEDLFEILNTKPHNCNDTCQPNCYKFYGFDQSTSDLLQNIEQIGEEEICSYIRNRYIVDEIFAPTQFYNSSTTYFGKNLIIYTEPRFNTGTTYNLNDRFNYCEKIYQCVVSGGTSGVTPSYSASTPYQYITDNKSMYYAKLPIPEYSVSTNYTKGSLVWYQDNIYQSTQNIRGVNPAQSMNLELRYGIPSVQGNLGVYPEFLDMVTQSTPPVIPTVSTQYWSLYNGPVSSWFTGTTYYFTGITPTNTTYWTRGDNRNPMIKMYLIDIILYHLHSRINPRNIPLLREIRYFGNVENQNGGAIGWLKNIEKGKINLNCPEIEPVSGNSIRFGSMPKKSNYFTILILLGMFSIFM